MWTGKTELFGNAESRQLSRTWRQTARDQLSIIFLRPLASPIACLEIYLGLLCVQGEYMRIKLNTSRQFSMRVSRICPDAFREARDRRKINDFGFDLPGQVQVSSRKLCMFQRYLRCAHALLQPVTHGSPSLRIRVDGAKMLLRVDAETFENGKKRLRFQIYPDRCGRGLTREKARFA